MQALSIARSSALFGAPAVTRRHLKIGAAAALLGWTGYTTAMMVAGTEQQDAATQVIADKDAEVAALRGKVAIMHRDTAALRNVVHGTVARIEERQAALGLLLGGDRGRMVLASADDVPAIPGAENLPAAARSVLAPLQRLESQQLSLIDSASTATRARYQTAQSLIRGLGLDIGRFSRSSRPAMGGPLERIGAEDGVHDLYEAWNSLAELGRAAASIPGRVPVSQFNYTSNFGVRYDPFNGGAAMHAGVDMAGSYGEPIVSTAEGVVVKAGWASGYGNMVEVDHGRGITTRYGHMSRVQVKIGDRVTAGDQIGKMGSTGRSTGTHLHYEVRVDGQAVDPMPYLRAAPQIAFVQSSAATAVGGPALPAPALSSPVLAGN